MRNPTWVRDEIILAMDLYVRSGRKQLPPSHDEVIRLSRLLTTLPLHDQSRRNVDFRNPNGISMILGNFLGIDPMHAQHGLSRNNHLQEKIWREFADRSDALRNTARAIEYCAMHGTVSADTEDVADADLFREGALLTRLHCVRERNRTVVERKKAQVLAERGRLACEVCGFDFEEVYGELGRGFAECHHLLPLAEGAFVRTTRLSDLAVLCANCHRVIHRVWPSMSVSELRIHVSARRTPSQTQFETINALAHLSR